MKSTSISATIIITVLMGLLIVGCVGGSQSNSTSQAKQINNLKIYSVDSAGSNIYGIFEGHGKINVDILNKKPIYRVLILQEKGLDTNYTKDLYKKINESLSPRGYHVTLVSPFADMSNSILVVPTGAMPEYVLDSTSKANKIIYVGRSDMVFESGTMKSKNWTASVPKSVKGKIKIYPGTARTVMSNTEEYNSIINEITSQKDNKASSKEINLNGEKKTYILYTGNQQTEYTVHITSNGKIQDYNYSSVDFDVKTGVNLFKEDIKYEYPNQETRYFIDLTNTNGTAYLYIYKNKEQIDNEELGRVKEDTIIPKTVGFNESGVYVLKVVDNTGEIKSGLIYVHNVDIKKTGMFGGVVEIKVLEDGAPVEKGLLTASLNDGKVSMNYKIDKGKAYIPTQMKEGKNVLHITYKNIEKNITLKYAGGVIDTYKTYLLPGVLLIIGALGLAYFLKKPKYYIRIPNAEISARKTVKTSSDKLLNLIPRIRKDLHLRKYDPLQIHEFMFGINKYITNGYDVFEENAEELVQKLVIAKRLIAYKDYVLERKNLYKEKDKIKEYMKNLVIMRKVRDILISKGKEFEERKDDFSFKLKKTHLSVNKIDIVKERNIQEISVFESLNDIHNYMSKLKSKKRIRVEMAKANHKLVLTTIGKLDKIL